MRKRLALPVLCVRVTLIRFFSFSGKLVFCTDACLLRTFFKPDEKASFILYPTLLSCNLMSHSSCFWVSLTRTLFFLGTLTLPGDEGPGSFILFCLRKILGKPSIGACYINLCSWDYVFYCHSWNKPWRCNGSTSIFLNTSIFKRGFGH